MVIKLPTEIITEIEKLISFEMAKLRIGGLSYAIVTKNEILYSNGIGAKNLEKNLPADINTIYNIASLSKSFIGTAIMILVDQGKLSINESVNKYIPLNLGNPEKPITIKHLMNHTSGIPDLSIDPNTYIRMKKGLPIRQSAKFIPLSSISDFFRLINNGAEFYHKIDQYFHYNNSGYVMLGLIIEKISGVEYFTDFIKEQIFKPLQMNNTSYNPEDFRDNEDMAVCYYNFSSGKTREIGPWYDKIFLAPGGIYSSTKDLVKYMQMHMSLGIWRDTRIITEKSALLMQQNSLLPNTMAKKIITMNSHGKSRGYGLGFFVDDDFYGEKQISHGGSNIGGCIDFQFLPNHNLGIIVQTNNEIGPHLLIKSILAMLMGVENSKNYYLEESRHFRSLNGIYENYFESDRIKVTGEVAKLTLTFIDQENSPKIEIIPLEIKNLNPMEFYTREYGGAKSIIFFEKINGQLWLNYNCFRLKRIGSN